jgi:hypothetical protein
MKRSLVIFLVLILTAEAAHTQSAKSVYFELGGPGLASFNFDTRFSGKEDGIGGRIGIGGFSISGDGAVFVPIAINYLLGKDGKNYFEMGAGVTPVIISDGGDDNFTSTFGHLNFGYRLQPAKGGFTFRAFITPVFGSWGFFPYWGGVSFGYKF